MSQANVEIVRRAIEGWNSGELDDDSLIGELFDPDFEWVPARDSLLAGGGYRGFAGLRRFRADLFSAWDEYALEAAEFVDGGDQVVAVVRIRARTRGIEVDEVWSALLSISEGRITRFQGFASREGALEAAGLRSSSE